MARAARNAVTEFRRSSGWAAGAGVEYVVVNEGGDISAETTNLLAPVIAVIFGQAGLKIGATLEGVARGAEAPRCPAPRARCCGPTASGEASLCTAQRTEAWGLTAN